MTLDQQIAAAQENVKAAMLAREEASIAYYSEEGEGNYERMQQAFDAANVAQDALNELLAVN